MKKYLLMLIVIIGINILAPSVYAQEIYENYIDQYSFEVPEGWVQIAPSRIGDLEKTANNDLVDYVAGYKNKEYEIPYLIIQKHDVRNMRLESWLEIMSPPEDSQNISNKYAQRIEGDIEIKADFLNNKSYIDNDINAIFFEFDLNVDGEKLKGLSIVFPGSHTSTQLNFYSLASDYEKNITTYRTITDSFRYKNGNGYQKTRSATDNSVGAGIGGAVSAGIAMLFFMLIGWIINLFKKKKKDE